MDIVAFRSHENNILETFLVAEIKSSVKKKRRSCPEIGRPHSHLKVVTFFLRDNIYIDCNALSVCLQLSAYLFILFYLFKHFVSYIHRSDTYRVWWGYLNTTLLQIFY